MRSAELSAAVRPTERLLQVLRLVYVGAIPLYAIVLLATSGGWPAPRQCLVSVLSDDAATHARRGNNADLFAFCEEVHVVRRRS